MHCSIIVSGVLVRILSTQAADLINLKISKVGGLTRARAVRDLAVSAGIPMNIEDTWFCSLPSPLVCLDEFILYFTGEVTL